MDYYSPELVYKAGMRFGQLVITGRRERYRSNTRIELLCDCGEAIWIPTNNLARGKISCGHKGRHKKDKGLRRLPSGKIYDSRNAVPYRDRIKGLCVVFASYRHGAIKRGLEFHLDKESLKEIVTQNCVYCGAEPTMSKQGMIRNGIDRFMNSVGYTKENCVPCCWSCNSLKGTLDGPDFLAHISRIQKFRQLEQIQQ